MSGTEGTRAILSSRWRRARWVVAVAAVVLGVAAVTALSVPRGNDVPLDPANPGERGARAVAQVLTDRGVRVRRVTRSGQLDTGAAVPSTLLVVSSSILGPRQLAQVAAARSDLVLVEPDAVVLDELQLPLAVAGTTPAEPRPAGCTVPAARAAGEARAGGRLYRLQQDAPVGARVCYTPADAQRHGARGRVGTVAVWRQSGRSVTVLGQSDVLTNRYLAADGNAALALWTLGARPDLVWYQPDPLEVGAGESPPSLRDLLPPAVPWVAAQLSVAVLLALVWRARRLGRLVPEPLPVVVRAAETEQGRARLYRQAGARGRAGATLRTATLRRLASRLSVPPGTTPEQVAGLTADVTGRPEDDVRDLLLGPAPGKDADLVALADQLDSLERDLAGSPAARSTTGRTLRQ